MGCPSIGADLRSAQGRTLTRDRHELLSQREGLDAFIDHGDAMPNGSVSFLMAVRLVVVADPKFGCAGAVFPARPGCAGPPSP